MASGATPVTSAARSRSPGLHRFRGLLETGGVRLDEVAVRQAVANDHVQHGHQQREIGSGTHRQKQVGVARDGGEAWIGHNQLRPFVTGPPDVVGGDGGALADIGADHHDDFRGRDVAPRVGRAVHAQRAFVRRACRHHAEAPVVIDVPGSQRHARELAHQVRLLGSERSAAVDRHRIRAVLFLQLAQPARREIESFVPSRRAKAFVGAHQRIEQPVRMVTLQVALDALGAQHSAVERKLLPGLETDDVVVAHFELNSALLAAEAAMGLHQFFGLVAGISLPASLRHVVQMRAVAAGQLVQRKRRLSHSIAP